VPGQDGDGNPAAPGDGAAYGIDFGWSRREGLVGTNGSPSQSLDPDDAGIRPDSVQPIAVFPHNATSDGHFSITGGYVYRGPVQDPAMQGKYFWSDFILAKSFAGSLDGEGVFTHTNITSDLTASAAEGGYAIHQITSYVEDAAGNIYLLDFGDECAPGCTGENGFNGFLTQFGTGELYRITVVPRLSGDYNDDGSVDAADYVFWRNRLGLVVGMPNDDTPGVGMDDYDRWKANYGTTSMEGGGAGAHGAIPEPSALALAALAAACCSGCRTIRGRRRPLRGTRR
jgi:hypothetical protein